MNTLVIVKNPFEPYKNREIRHVRGRVLCKSLYDEYGGQENITVFIDGQARTAEYLAPKNSLITVVPVVGKGGKSIFGIIAMVAVAAISMGVGSVAAGGSFFGSVFGGSGFITAGAWGAGAFAAAAATMFIGSALVSRATFQKIDVGKYDYENNPTYSWGDPQTTEGQNNPIPLTYGKVQSAGQTIGKFVSLNGDKEVLNWLIACGEGELEISNIRLNDNEISYYTDVTAEIRSGTNDQSVISNFNDTYSSKSFGYELTDDTERIDTAPGNATQGLIIKLECSNGLYYAKDDGSLGTAWVQFSAWYRVKNTTAWTTWITNQRISGSQSSALRKEFSKQDLPARQYEVKVVVTGRSHSTTSSRASTKMWWTSVTSVVYDDFSYPNIALIGIKGVATSQLSGTPTLKFIKERKNVWVWNGYNYVQKPANNPAWASYDVLHQCRRLRNTVTGEYEYVVRGVPANAMMYDRFSDWADFCEEKELYVNIELCTSGEMLDVVNNKIACIGRGLVVRFGTKYGCLWDSVQTPVQMFGMGNIIADTFEETFLQISDRANCVELTYTDAERDFSRETIRVYSDTYDTDGAEKVAQVTYDGCTSYEQAFREAKFQLYCNKYILRTVSFEADIDSIACMVGDVILVAHDVPEWGYSGRVYSVDDTEIVLPVELSTTEGDYLLQYRSVDDTIHEVEATIVSSEDGYTTITIEEQTVMPEPNDIFVLGLVNHGAKPFKVTNIDRAQNFRRKITAKEYNENIYREDYDIPPIQYTPIGQEARNVLDLEANQITYTMKDGTKRARLYISWNYPVDDDGNVIVGGAYSVAYSTDGQQWVYVTTTSQNNIYVDVEPFTIYYVRVITQLGARQSSGATFYPVLPGEDSLPPSVVELNAERIADGTRRYYWNFTYPDPNDIAGFKMRVIAGSQPNWNLGSDVQDGLITTQPYEATTIRQGVHTVMIKAVDNAGQESANYTYCVMDFGDIIADNVLQTVDFSENGWKSLLTDGFWVEDMATEFWLPNMATLFWKTSKMRGLYIGSDGYLHSASSTVYWSSAEIPAWEGADEPAWEASFQEIYAEFSMTADAGGYWWLEYEIDGAVRIKYWINDDGIKKDYSTRVKVKAGDVIHVAIESDPSDVTVRKLIGIVDVPDRVEHFDNIEITTAGVELPIKTPHYQTTAVRIDSMPVVSGVAVYPQIVSRTPCVIKLASADGSTVSAIADITWQGYEMEVENG